MRPGLDINELHEKAKEELESDAQALRRLWSCLLIMNVCCEEGRLI